MGPAFAAAVNTAPIARGSQVKAEEHDPEDFDEGTCPWCNGSGQTGLVGDGKLCKGNGFVTEAKATAYRNKYQ